MKTLGMLLFFACGVSVYLIEIVWFFRWWGNVGAFVGVLFPPAGLVFPFLYSAKEEFSLSFFGLWAGAIVGMIIVSLSRRRKPEEKTDKG